MRSDQVWPILDLTGSTAELDPEQLRRSCRDLRLELLASEEPWRQVALLRSLAEHRAALSRFNGSLRTEPATATAAALADTGEYLAVGRSTRLFGPAPDSEGPALDHDGESGIGKVASGEEGSGANGVSSRTGGSDRGDRRGEPPEGSGSDEPDDQPLTLRFLVEGPPRAGTSTIVELMAEHFETPVSTSAVIDGEPTVHWLEFSAGSFERRPIRFEVCSLGGSADRPTRHYLRTLVDAVILVVEATPKGLAVGAERVAELIADGTGRNDLNRADLTVFAHKSDRPDAVGADEVGDQLGLSDGVRVVSTTWERRGSSHALALATSSALRRLERRDSAGCPRTVALSRSGFLTLIRGGLPAKLSTSEADPGGHESSGPVPAPTTGSAPTGPATPGSEPGARSVGATPAEERAADHHTSLDEPGASGIQPIGAQPVGAQPSGIQPVGAQPVGAQPSGIQPVGAQPSGIQPVGAQPVGPSSGDGVGSGAGVGPADGNGVVSDIDPATDRRHDPPGVDRALVDPAAEDAPAEGRPAVDPPTEDPPAVDPPSEDALAINPSTEDRPPEGGPAEDGPAEDGPAEDGPADDRSGRSPAPSAGPDPDRSSSRSPQPEPDSSTGGIPITPSPLWTSSTPATGTPRIDQLDYGSTPGTSERPSPPPPGVSPSPGGHNGRLDRLLPPSASSGRSRPAPAATDQIAEGPTGEKAPPRAQPLVTPREQRSSLRRSALRRLLDALRG
jgi:hypothetical protein